MKQQCFFALLACVLGHCIVSCAQAVPAASRMGTLQLGLGGTIASPDYGPQKVKGLTVYGDFDFTKHIGVEGDIHLANVITPDGVGEESYLLGPRWVFHHNRFNPYAKAIFGIGRLQYQSATYTSEVYSLGGGVDIRATDNLNIRAFDLEYQEWPGVSPHGLSPIVGTIGVAYSFR